MDTDETTKGNETMATKTMNVTELDRDTRIDREHGGVIMYQRFQVQRLGSDPHIVRVEVSHSGTPQDERCDCKGFKFKRECAHIDAVYTAGMLYADCEM